MKNKKLWLLYPVLALLLAFSLAMPVSATDDPVPLPHNFYGSVIIDTEPASAGTEVEARGEGVMTTEVNPITTTEEGQYGGPGPTEPKLEVQGYIDEGTPIEFYIGGVRAQCREQGTETWLDTYPWHNGDITELNLSIGEAPPPSLTAEAGGPYSGIVEATIALSGSASSGTAPYTYAWDLDNDSVYDDATGASPSHSWDTAGIHTIGLQVTDNVSATATDTATVTVTVTAFDPYIYDTNEDEVMSKAETLAAVDDYLAGNITKDEVLEVVKLYFS